VTGLSSDSHTWNLVFLQLYLEERGHEVVNLGPCVPDELLVRECVRLAPDLVVVSSVNGHGQVDGGRVIRKLRERTELAATPVVIGGKLGTAGGQSDSQLRALLELGFNAVFDDGAKPEDGAGPGDFSSFLEGLTPVRGEIAT
jgi:methylaspartate mutase sigma subunit